MTFFTKPVIIASLLLSALSIKAATLPQGQLYKISVSNTGIHEITPAQLALMGFSSAQEVSIYGYGGVENRNIDMSKDIDGLPEVPTMVTDDGRLLFYGEGPTRYSVFKTTNNTTIYNTAIDNNSYSLEGYYFLAPSNSPRRVATAEVTPGSTTLKSHCSSYIYFPQSTNPASAGAYFLGDDIAAMPDHEITFNIPLIDLNPSDAWEGLWYNMSSRSSQNSFTIQNLNNAPSIVYTSASASNLNNADIYFNSAVNKSSNTRSYVENYNVTFSFKKNTTTTYAALGYLTLTYNRLNNILDRATPMPMYFYGLNAGAKIDINNATDNTVVWDVTDCVNTTALPTTLSGTTLTAVAAKSRTASSSLIAFDPTCVQSPVTLHKPVTVGRLHDMATPDIVIITAPVYKEYAQRLAQLHLDYQGLKTEIVTQQEIFDEFGSGARSPYAIRRFMKYLYDRDPATLKHLIIFGPATFDPAGHLSGLSSDETHVLTYESENFATQGQADKCYASDAFFAYLDNNNCINAKDITISHMTINVGRIACINEGQALAYVNKVERYLKEPPTVDIHSHALSISDHGDDNSHLNQAIEVCNLIQDTHAPHAVVIHAFSALYDRSNKGQERYINTVISALNKGVGYMTYSGHANTATIGSDSFFKRNNIMSLENKFLPLIMLSTCYAVGYDRDENTVGQQFVFNEKGGGIAVIGSGRAVSREYNQILNKAVAIQQFNIEDNEYIGDVYRLARNNVAIGYVDNIILGGNCACYNFMGDPALPRYAHTHAMQLEIPDKKISIRPLERNIVTGTVLNDEGKTDASFNGKAIINLYAPAEYASTNYDVTGCTPKTFTRREKLITSSVAEVKDGAFTSTLLCPENLSTGNGFRILAHAISDTGHERAVTYTDSVSTVPLADNPELADGTLPQIESLYIDNENFNNGDIVPSDFKVWARIIPSTSGLRLTPTIDAPIYIDIDGTRHSDINSFITTDIDGSSYLKYDITGLADGPHELTLAVSDNAGSTTKESLNFHVITRPHTALAVTENTSMTEANITLTHTLTTEPVARLVIEDREGNTVYTASDVMFPFNWNLTDNDGNAVSDGRYTVHALLQAGNLRAAATPATVTIVR